jgi:TonB family protein
MKHRVSKHAALALAACLTATSAASARKTKIDSVGALAHLLAAKLPHSSKETVYVGFPVWKGQGDHYLLLEKIGEELGQALSAADPTDKVVTSPEATAILSKAGFQPLDVYYGLGSIYAARLIGAPLVITTEIRLEGDGLALTVEAMDPARKKRYAKLKALLPDSPHIHALLSQPDVPVKDGAGVYEAGVGGVGLPTCVHCPNPELPPDAARDAARASSRLILIGLTVGTNGEVISAALLEGSQASDVNRIALETVRSWRLHPVRGPGGKLVPVHMIVEIQIRL